MPSAPPLPTHTPAPTEAYPKRWAAAIVMILAALMDMIDGSIVNTALPSIGRDLAAGPSQLEWTISAYLLGFASTLIVAGHLGDRFGRKRLFLGGVAAFAAASLWSALAANGDVLVASRAVQGVAAAVIIPQVLGTLRTIFHGAERGKVFAIYGAIAGLSVTAGVLLGGLLTDWDLFGWHWRTVFAINIPLAVTVLVLGARWIPEHQPARAGSVRPLSALVLAASLVAIVLPLAEGRSNGWPLWGWLTLAAGIVGLVALTAVQHRRGIADPLLPVALLRTRAFTVGVLIQMLFFGAMSGFMLGFTLWLQIGRGYGPTQAGLVMAAFSVGTMISAPFVDTLILRMGRSVLVMGGLGLAAGFVWLGLAAAATSGPTTNLVSLLPGLVLAGIGLGLLIVPLSNIVLTAAHEDVAGNASGVFSTAQQFGGALGVATLGSIFFGRLGDGYSPAIGAVTWWVAAGLGLCAVLALAIPARAIREAYPGTPSAAA